MLMAGDNYEWIKWHLTGPAIRNGRYKDAYLYFGSTRTRDESFDFASGRKRGRLQLYAWDVQPGRYKLRVDAWDHNYNELSTKPAYTRVKFGARVGLKAKRHHRRVALRATAKRYSNWRGWVRYKHAKVKFQRKHSRHWKTFRIKRTDRYGAVAARIKHRKRSKYRAVVVPTNRVWARTSRTRRR